MCWNLITSTALGILIIIGRILSTNICLRGQIFLHNGWDDRNTMLDQPVNFSSKVSKY